MTYLIFMLPAMALGLIAQLWLKAAYSRASGVPVRSGLSGAQAAQQILSRAGLSNVGVEVTQGHLSDHYDPKHKVLRLSPDVYSGRSLAAVGIAAHEAGHALQDAKGYAPLALRNAVVPLASFGSSSAFIIIFLGAAMNAFNLVLLGVLLFSLVVAFQIINLPVEFNASSRAKEILFQQGIIATDERGTVSNVLSAAAMTYVAGTISSILTLLYYLVQLGVLGGRRED